MEQGRLGLRPAERRRDAIGVTYELLLLILVVVTGLSFDFTNGFHDTANAMATSIATGALKPRVAVAISAVLNLAGAFISFAVAATIAKGLVHAEQVTLPVVLAGLCGGIIWNLLTWLLGIPSSSSHALNGGVIGATIAHAGFGSVFWVSGLLGAIVFPAILSPIIAMIISAISTWVIYHVTGRVADKTRNTGFRWGQIGSASLVSLAHGTNDAQKTMGIIFLALTVAGFESASASRPPIWVIVGCALAIALGTYSGGWRVIRTLGKGLVEIESPQGMAAETSSAAVIMLSSVFGASLSTTHVATGSILGTGIGKAGAVVRWNVAGRMGVAWLLTLPAAAIVGAVCSLIASLGTVGPIIVFVLLLGVASLIFVRARRKNVGAHNVNDDWDGAQRPAAIPAEAAPTA